MKINNAIKWGSRFIINAGACVRKWEARWVRICTLRPFPRELARMVFLLFCSPTLQTFMMCLYVCREVQKLTENEMSSMWVLKRECTEISLSSTLKRYSLLSMWSDNKAICIQLTSFINAQNILISSDFIYLRSVTFSNTKICF